MKSRREASQFVRPLFLSLLSLGDANVDPDPVERSGGRLGVRNVVKEEHEKDA